MNDMNWLNLEHLLLDPRPDRLLCPQPALSHAQFCAQALSAAAGLQARGVQRLAVHLDDAGDLAIALFAAWRAGVSVLLPSDLQDQTRERWNPQVDLWLSEQPGDARLADLLQAPWPRRHWTWTPAN